jgi:hypothetical protein
VEALLKLAGAIKPQITRYFRKKWYGKQKQETDEPRVETLSRETKGRWFDATTGRKDT